MSTAVVLDKAGRFVLPKQIRDRLNLSAGSKMRIEVVGDKLELSLQVEEPKIVKRGKRRVVVGWKGFDATEAVNEARKEQLERLESPASR